MLVSIYLFTLLISFVLYKTLSKYQELNKDKSTWKMLIYWGALIFISIIFNIVLYTNNPSNYKMSFYANEENLHLIGFIFIFYLVVQILSPTIFKGKVKLTLHSLRLKLKKKKVSDASTNTDSHSNKITNKDILNNSDSFNIKPKDLQEKEFEVFLNTLCWLSFSFAIFIQIFFAILTLLQSYEVSIVLSEGFISNYAKMQEELNDISCFLMLVTLPVSLRQIIFYLGKLKRVDDNTAFENSDFLRKNPKYILLQKRLSQKNNKL